MRLTRRHLLQLAPLGLGLLVPRLALAGGGSPAGERKFLFVLADGGWDTTMVFTPKQDDDAVDTEDDAVESQIGGITLVEHAEREAVSDFFLDWGDQACVINGVEVRSVTHERCKRILMTGSGTEGVDDWPSMIAAASSGAPPLPYLVVYGLAYNAEHAASVVRVGSSGQLPDLLDGTALSQSEIELARHSPEAEELAAAWLRERTGRFATGPGAERFGRSYGRAQDTLLELRALDAEVGLRATDAGCTRDMASDASIALECFQEGLARCAMVQYDGWCGERWDTHADNAKQSTHFQLLFGYLNDLMADLHSRTTPEGTPLADEVTVVVLSEMGRHPQLNAAEGKDHWTFTSAMLVGSGVAGDQVIGGLDADFAGERIDTATGELDSEGVGLVPDNLGATLLELAGVERPEHLGAVPPVEAALS